MGSDRDAAPAPAPSPVLRWAGGKRRLLPALRAIVPETFGVYYEPFFGGGALLCDLMGEGRLTSAVVGDLNRDLVGLYETLKSAPGELVEYAEREAGVYVADPESTYYRWRDRFNAARAEGAGGVEVSALLLLLNRTCFNGLWRVNSSGGFNVPWGRLKNPTLVDRDGLADLSAALQDVELVSGEYLRCVRPARRGDLVYFDPPYVRAGFGDVVVLQVHRR